MLGYEFRLFPLGVCVPFFTSVLLLLLYRYNVFTCSVHRSSTYVSTAINTCTSRKSCWLANPVEHIIQENLHALFFRVRGTYVHTTYSRYSNSSTVFYIILYLYLILRIIDSILQKYLSTVVTLYLYIYIYSVRLGLGLYIYISLSQISHSIDLVSMMQSYTEWFQFMVSYLRAFNLSVYFKSNRFFSKHGYTLLDYRYTEKRYRSWSPY